MAATLEEIERIYRSGYARFYRFARAATGDHARAVDSVQEAFARAIRSRAGFRGEAQLETWLWKVLVNTCVDENRRRAADDSTDEHVDDVAVFDSAAAEQRRHLRVAISSLPARQRLILFLRYYADLEYDAIATVAGVERGTVAATLNHAHAALKRRLTEVVP
jgi:RNA polymerase sigma-70 factor (ECF subfamily)